VLGKDRIVLVINISSVANDQYKDGEDIVLDLVDDAVVAYADAITGASF
jgi:hypothetical protein